MSEVKVFYRGEKFAKFKLFTKETCSIKSKKRVNIIQVFLAGCEIRDKGRSRVRQWRDLEFYDRVTRGSWPPAGPEALRGKSIYRRPNKNTNDDDGARSASFGFRKRLEIVREKETQSYWKGENKEDESGTSGKREKERKRWKQRTRSGATHAKRGKKLSIKRRERPRRLSGTKTSPSAVRSSNTLFSLFSFLLLPQDRIDPRRSSILVRLYIK